MNKKSCVFYNKTFFEDLYPFSISSTSDNKFEIIFDVDGNIQKKSLDFIFPSILSGNSNISTSSWFPIMIDLAKSESLILNNYLAGGFSMESLNLGIESIIKFDPVFRNWNSSGKMVADWILTPQLYPYVPDEGILCWAKKIKNSNEKPSFFTLDQIPYNTIIYSSKDLTYTLNNMTVSITPNTKLLKKSNNIVLILDNDKIIKRSDGSISPNTQQKYFILSDFIQARKDAGITLDKNTIVFSIAKENDSSYIYHISKGEAYSYYESMETKEISIKDKLPSLTYLSPVLHDIYRQIYHNLTLNRKKEFNKKIPKAPFTRVEGRRLKKLCYFLATHPQVDRTTVSVLQSNGRISEIINDYIFDTDYATTHSISDILEQVSISFMDMGLLIDEAKYLDPAYVPKKLLEKYGASLRIESGGTLNYKWPLNDGPHIKVNSDMKSLAKKNLKNSLICSNIVIDVNPFVIKTSLDESQSVVEVGSKLGIEKNIIPLWDIQKSLVIKQGAPFSVGPDIQTTFDNPTNDNDSFFAINSTGKELSIDLKVAGLGFDQRDSALAGVDISYNWTRIYGSNCLKFSNRTLTDVRNNGILTGDVAGSLWRFDSSQDESPTIYIKRPGKYVIQCAVNTPFGVKTQRLNLYIIGEGYSKPKNEIPRAARIIDLLPDSKNIIMTHGMREFVIGKQGIFWPVYSDLSIFEPQYTLTPSLVVAGLEVKRRIGELVKPLGSVLNKFTIPFDRNNEEILSKLNSMESELKFTFPMSNGVSMDISHIILSNINSELNPNCEPIYRETFDHRLGDLELDSVKVLVDPISKKDIDIPRPTEIGTNFLSLGTDEGLSKTMFDSTDESLIFPSYKYNREIYSSSHTDSDHTFSSDTNPVICHEIDSDLDARLSFSSLVQKGYFHPTSGWIYQSGIKDDTNLSNKTSIMIGDGSKRYCKTFKGLGFGEINNDFLDEQVKIYQSSITLSMSNNAHDYIPKEGEGPEVQKQNEIEHEKQETDDHNPNHGYRDLSGRLTSLYKYNDEFIVSPTIVPDAPVSVFDYCNTNKDIQNNDFAIGEIAEISYSYPKPGPIFANKTNSNRNFRFDRNFGRTLGDLEIKLNYLNYINPKELVIWLTIDAPDGVTTKIINTKDDGTITYSDPLYFSGGGRDNKIDIINSIPNSGIREYMINLFNLHDNICSGDGAPPKVKSFTDLDPKFYLYLLNQDHIDMSSYNNIIKFTDNISDNNSNINVGKFITANTSQARLKNGIIELSPTLSASGYNDHEINQYKTILKSNNLEQYIPCKFNKFHNMPMFAKNIPPAKNPPAKNAGSITFTLNIAVIGESDNGAVYDRILSTNNLINLNNLKIKNVSSIPTNSLCSWEIIINNNKGLLNFEDKDAFGQINYISTSGMAPYDGYNFIGKIKPNNIPPVNKDAPNKSLYDIGKCFYSRERLTTPRNFPLPQLNIMPFSIMIPFTIIGAVAAASALVDEMNNQSTEIFNYFNDLKRIRFAEIFNREIYIPRFTEFPMGRSDKALISASQDGIVWFKLEAGILRYNNCPILKKKQYLYKTIDYTNELKALAKFTLNIMTDPSSIILYKTKIIQAINSPDIQEYNLSLETIQTNINESIDNGLLNLVKNYIFKINTELQTLEDIEEPTTENKTRISKLNDLISEYRKLYHIIGPEGIREDDILLFQSTEKNDETEVETINKKYYTVIKNNKLSLINFTELDTLLKYNKSLFIDNNLFILFNNLKDYPIIETTSSEKPEQKEKPKSELISINSTRPYSIYKNFEEITIYTPRNDFSEDEKKQLATANEALSTAREELAIAMKKDPPDLASIEAIESAINSLENVIFGKTHNKSKNKIKAKGILRNKTILILDEPVEDGAILVIEPYHNRIIMYDKNYLGKDNDNTIPNPWSFINNVSSNCDSMPTPNQNIFNNGTYGTGSVNNNPIYLYNPEIVNYVKDFIDYIDNNRIYNDELTDKCIITAFGEVASTSVGRLHTFAYDKDSLIEKYNNFIQIRPSDTSTFKFNDVLQVFEHIMKYDEYNAFFKRESLKGLIEGSLEGILEGFFLREGSIELDSSIDINIIYGLEDKTQLDLLKHRLESKELTGIPGAIIELQGKIKEKNKELADLTSKNISETEKDKKIEQIRISIKEYKTDIAKLQLEYNRLSFYMEKLNKNEYILPNISIKLIQNENNSISIQEKSNDDYYVINIDAEQGCSIDLDKMPRILTKIEYTCLGAVGATGGMYFYVNGFRFCGNQLKRLGAGLQGGKNAFIVGGTYSVDTSNYDATTYTMLPEKIEELKNQKKHYLLDWNQTQTHYFERSFYLNGVDSRGGIVKAKYTYEVPKYKTPIINAEGSLQNKVKDIFNLNKTDSILIDFKQINRNLRNVDSLYNKYIPSIDGQLVKSISPPPGGPIDNTLKIWQCYSYFDGSKLSLPPNFKWMNLVKYMSFYNKYLFPDNKEIFDINSGLDLIKTRDEMGLIPYDYK